MTARELLPGVATRWRAGVCFIFSVCGHLTANPSWAGVIGVSVDVINVQKKSVCILAFSAGKCIRF